LAEIGRRDRLKTCFLLKVLVQVQQWIIFMFVKQLSTNFFLFLLSIIGVVTNRRNLLIILMGVELSLLSLNLSLILFSIYFDDIYGQLFSLFILAIAASESAVGLAVIILYYRVRGSIFMSQVPVLRS
jgi:NADH-quinone oxidoreductase subunit K